MFSGIIEEFATVVAIRKDKENIDFTLRCSFVDELGIDQSVAHLPYIKQCAERVSTEGYTLMRPLVFDFSDDPEALRQPYEYMFGPRLLVSPVTEPSVSEWTTYLPRNPGGWRCHQTGQHYDGGQYITTIINKTFIPVFERE